MSRLKNPISRVHQGIMKRKSDTKFISNVLIGRSCKKYFCINDNAAYNAILMDILSQKLNIKQMSDWYTISKKDFIESGGKINKNETLQQLIPKVYPEYNWLPWRFANIGAYWDDVDNQRSYMEWVRTQLNIKEMSDWYKVSYKDLTNLGAEPLLKKYNNSIYQVLAAIYPDYDWLLWYSNKCPSGYWEDVSNHIKFMDNLAVLLNIKEMKDWYKITALDIANNGGSGFFHLYNYSVLQLLSKVFPHYEWLPWLFLKCPQRYWDDITNQRRFLEWAFRELKLKDMSDWYKISINDIKDIGGIALLHKYSNSPSLMLASVYPEYNWLPWLFTRSSLNTFSLVAVLKFIEYVANKYQVGEHSDWYRITPKDIIDNRRGIILLKYSTLPQLLTLLYPSFNWEYVKFKDSRNIWTEDELARYYVDYLTSQRDIKELEYVNKFIISKKFKTNNALLSILAQEFPEYKWPISSKTTFKKSQYYLKECLNTLFKGEEVLEEYRHPDLVSKYPLELDFYLPKYNIAFEYQGIQHYKNISVFHGLESLDQNMQRDISKSSLCEKVGITLIEIPYWWDRRLQSLYATVYNRRPDLLTEIPSATPIPLIPPTNTNAILLEDSVRNALMNATEWDTDSMDPDGWWMSEKYDGVRLYWDGAQFYSRSGELVHVPDSIKTTMPKVALDGELWTQYGLFQEAVNLCKSKNTNKWNNATYWVFDTPSPSLSDKPYEERLGYLKSLSDLPTFIHIAESIKCTGKEHLLEYFNKIIEKGGEGVMLREPSSTYSPGRSKHLRKFKPFIDTEVKVIQNQYPHGLVCEQINGKIIFVHISSKNVAFANSVDVGSIVTVKYNGINKHGTLQFPQFYRKREDVQWEILKNS